MNLFGERRKLIRAKSRTPLGLACTSYKTNLPFQVTVFNASDNGLCLETTHKLEPDDDIFFHKINYVPLGITTKLLSENVGIIKWLETIRRGDSYGSYRAGIKFY